MINWQLLFLPLFTVQQYLFCANSIVCYSFKTHPNIITLKIVLKFFFFKLDIPNIEKVIPKIIDKTITMNPITNPPHIIKCFLLKIQGFLTLSVSVNKPEL